LSDHRLFVTIQYALAPTAGAAATIVGTIGPFGQSQFFQDSAPIGVANARNGTATFVLERGWLFNFTATNATLGQLRAVPLLG
jgi:hypothetical protein